MKQEMCLLISGNQAQGTCIKHIIVHGPKFRGALSQSDPTFGGCDVHRQDRWRGRNDMRPSRNGECRRWPVRIQADLGYNVSNSVWRFVPKGPLCTAAAKPKPLCGVLLNLFQPPLSSGKDSCLPA